MNSALVHRGPDEQALYAAGGVALAMRRLSIIDLEHGSQPAHDESGRIQLVFNGEIYNHRDLRLRLVAKGHRFISRSDTEVVAHAVEDRGVSALHDLRGMFALALWESTTSELLLAVDRLGIKPLYYIADEERIVFASELAALRASGLAGDELDYEALAQYFTLGYIPHPATAFLNVRKLEPGTYLRWNAAKGVRIERYWEPPVAADGGCRAASRPAVLRDLLRDSVTRHLESDVPVGAFLSGGVDSSTVVALMREAGADKISTFSIGFSSYEGSELPVARAVASRFETDHHEQVVTPDATVVLPLLARHYGEPFADSSALPTYYVSKLARERVKVVLTGDGGDELFIGYPMFAGVELARRLEVVPQAARRWLSHRIGGRRYERIIPANVQRRLADSLQGAALAYEAKLSRPGLGKVRPFLSTDLRLALDGAEPFAPLRHMLDRETERGGAEIEAVVLSALRMSLPGDMLTKVDRASMANSVEARVPLLDHVLVEAVSHLPIRERVPRLRLKGLLKDAMADVLPPEVVRSPKKGFNLPLSSWTSGPGGIVDFARDVLLSPKARSRGTLVSSQIERWLSGTGPRLARETDVLWSLLMFELWSADAGI